jgi:hypothetical protein
MNTRIGNYFRTITRATPTLFKLTDLEACQKLVDYLMTTTNPL